MNDNGWIALNRKIQQHWIWSKDKPFDCRSAWIDLILLANHKDNTFPLGTEMVEVKRGSFVTSELKLSDRWGWSKTKVRNFLKLLENDNMIHKISDHKKTAIVIVNYSVWQDKETTEKAEENHIKTSEEPVQDTNNNDITMINNENNNKNNIVPLSTKDVTTSKYARDSFEMLCVETLIHSCLELYPNSKVPTKQSDKVRWAVEVDRMKRLDNRTEEDIRQALEFAINNSFWKQNIRSAKKFREKFETLLIQSKQNKSLSVGGVGKKQTHEDFNEMMKGWLENE